MSPLTYQLGQTVYILQHRPKQNDLWNTDMVRCVIADIFHKTLVVKKKSIVDSDGTDLQPDIGTLIVNPVTCYDTPEDAHQAIQTRREKAIQIYCDEIQTVQDLIYFPLHYDISKDPCPNEPARTAYLRRAKELLDIPKGDLT